MGVFSFLDLLVLNNHKEKSNGPNKKRRGN
jgi:hypothetical protein